MKSSKLPMKNAGLRFKTFPSFSLNKLLEFQIARLLETLNPLRSGTPLISAEEIEELDKDWTRWRAEWVHRRNIGKEVWCMFTDSLSPQDATDLAEELGVEVDSPEHLKLERSTLCAVKVSRPLKRK